MTIAARALIGLLAIALAFTSVIAQNTATDPTAAFLDRARDAYESAIDRLCANTTHGLDNLGDAAERSRDPVRVDIYEAMRERFEGVGELPDIPNRDHIERDYARATAAMLKAYQDVQLKYEREGLGDLLRSVADDAEQFASHWDLIPWSEDLLEDAGESVRTVEAGAFRMIPVAPGESYRMHIRARALADDANLRVGLPIRESSTHIVPARAQDHGEYLIILTVRGDRIAPDLGAPRPLTPTPIEDSRGDAIVIYADGAPIFIDSVRIKPLVEGAPPKLDQLANKPAKDEPDAGRKMRFERGMHGTGKCIHRFNRVNTDPVTVSVERVEGTEIILRATITGTGESFLLTCAVTEKDLTVRNSTYTGPTRRGCKARVQFKSKEFIAGTGVMSRGKLNLSWNVRGDVGGKKNLVRRFQLVDVALR